MLLGDRDPGTVLRRDPGRTHAAGSATDHEQIDVVLPHGASIRGLPHTGITRSAEATLKTELRFNKRVDSVAPLDRLAPDEGVLHAPQLSIVRARVRARRLWRQWK